VLPDSEPRALAEDSAVYGRTYYLNSLKMTIACAFRRRSDSGILQICLIKFSKNKVSRKKMKKNGVIVISLLEKFHGIHIEWNDFYEFE